nr:DUF4224 domain-containing protein [uncultured Roseateles sp.]
MSALFLTPAELVELTGFKQTKGHVRWLDRYRWRYVLTRSEQPRVARDYFLDRMGIPRSQTGFSDKVNQAAALEEPDFSALDRI